MTSKIVVAAGFLATLLVGACSSTSSQTLASNDPDQHTTAASGFGLGPEYFKSNGGAFGPDQLDH